MKTVNPISAPGNGPSLTSYESVNLDFLRSVAVLLVFGAHYYDIRNGASVNLGLLGVLMFFVHTCLVLMWSLERCNLRGRHLFAQFYVRRVMRIYPLAIVAVLFGYFFDARWSPVNLWQSLTLTQYVFFKGSPSFPPQVTPLWTLPLEVGAYVALPVLFLALRNRPVKLLALIWPISVGLSWFQPQFGMGFTILRYMPCFLGGVVAWRLMRDRDRQRLPGWVWPLALATVVLLWKFFSTEKFIALWIAAVGISLGLAIPLFREIRSSRVAEVSKIIARYSYGIYLSHFPIMVYIMTGRTPNHPLFKVFPPMPLIRHFARPIDAILVLSLTAFASFSLHYGIEKPGIQLGRAMAQWLASTSRPKKSDTPLKADRGIAICEDSPQVT